jgi:hypothetical protein
MSTTAQDPPESHEYRVIVDGVTLAYAGPDPGAALKAYFFHVLWGGHVELLTDGKPIQP